MTSAVGEFRLSFDARAHDGAVRCCCVFLWGGEECVLTGSLDSSVILWKSTGASSDSSEKWTAERVYRHHSDFVLCVADAGEVRSCSSSSQRGSSSAFYSGGKDRTVKRVCIDSGEVELEFKGHSAPVCSVTPFGSRVASGDWTANACIWSSDSGELIHTLSLNHAFAVTLCSLPPLLLSGSQSGILNIWGADGALKKCISKAHSDIIRSICALPLPPDGAGDSLFASVANDCSLKVWSENADDCLACQSEAHDGFIFHVCANANPTSCLLVTSGDDCLAKLWKVERSDAPHPLKVTFLEALPHPGTVWQAASLANGDVVTCCADGHLRFWSQDPSRILSEEAQLNYISSLAKKETVDAKTGEAIRLADLPSEEEVRSRRNAKEGEVCLCRRGDEAVVWLFSGGSWLYQGVALNPIEDAPPHNFAGDGSLWRVSVRLQYFPKGKYDFLLRVEVGNEEKILPFNIADNPLVAAETFVARENLPRSAVAQISSFICENVASTGGSLPSKPARSDTSSQGTLPVYRQQRKHFPVLEPLSFSKASMSAIVDALRDRKGQLGLSELESVYLEELLTKLNSTDVQRTTLRDCELNLLGAVLPACGPENPAVVPILDLLRLCALRADFATVLRKASSPSTDAIALGVGCLRAVSASWESGGSSGVSSLQRGSALCSLRLLANVLASRTTAALLLRRGKMVCQVLSGLEDALSFIAEQQNPHKLAAGGVFLNLSILAPELSQDDADRLLRVLVKWMRCERDAKHFYTLAVAAGTLLVGRKSVQTRLDASLLEQLQSSLPPLNDRLEASPALNEAAQELFSLLETK